MVKESAKQAARAPLWRRALLGIVVSILVFVGALAVVEGLISVFLEGWDLAFNAEADLPSRVHSVPDTLLGWVNKPGFRNDAMYGRGGALVINQQGLRASAAISPEVPAGRVRFLCSGDSFTFGIGVSNDDTWCARLQSADPHVETVNLGHAGYGIDQAYLFYQREGLKLAHDVHVLAFIPDDFRRLRLARFVGYAKPEFQLSGDSLLLENVPVPAPSRFGMWYQRRSGLLGQLRIVQLGQRINWRVNGRYIPDRLDGRAEARAVAVRLFQRLQNEAQQAGRIVVFVLLDERAAGSGPFDALASALSADAAKRGLNFIDLRHEFRQISADSLEAMFDARFGGHYSARGNARVSSLLAPRLLALPQVAARLKSVSAGPAH